MDFLLILYVNNILHSSLELRNHMNLATEHIKNTKKLYL